MKRAIYILCFVVLGILFQQLIHAFVEIWYLNKYGMGELYKYHKTLSVILLILGAFFGFQQGKYWWPKLYDENGKVRKPFFWRI